MSLTQSAVIDISKPRYDQSTFYGRFRHFLNVTDMRTLFTTRGQIEDAKKVISEYNATRVVPNGDPEILWRAQKIKDTILHPDTNEPIFLPFRVSAFVPANTLLCMGMLLPGAGLANQVFWQWLNQSYNICLNHANRNASNPITNKELTVNYCSAVLASCGVAVGLGRGVKRLHISNSVKNIITMCRHGINVKTEDGIVVGKSKIAGLSALKMVATSRIVTSIPVLTLVPFTLNGLMKTKWLSSRPQMVNVVNILLIIIALQTALPAAIALFPQTIKVPSSSLEPEFSYLKDEKGNPIKWLYYNRGL